MRRLTLLGLALLGALALQHPGSAREVRREGRSSRDAGRHRQFDQDRRHVPAVRDSVAVRDDPGRDEGLLQLRERDEGPDGKRGVFGRQINWVYYDDVYNPANSVQLTRRLVQQDQVFAVVGSLGTEVNLAIRPYLNAAQVPHLFPASGAETFARDWKRFPWTTAWFPDYVSEGLIYGRHIRRTALTRRSASSTRTTITARICSTG